MDIWTSVIIGGVVGAIGGAVAVLQASRGHKKIVAAITSGDHAQARTLIDKRWPHKPRPGLSGVLVGFSRITALGALGDTEALASELEAMQARRLSVRIQLSVYSRLVQHLLGGTGSGGVAAIEGLVAEIEGQGGKLLAMVKRQSRLQLALAKTASGIALSEDDRQMAQRAARQSPHFLPAYQLALANDAIAKGDVEGATFYRSQMENAWGPCAYVRRADQLLGASGNA